jgi:hypothetical protein
MKLPRLLGRGNQPVQRGGDAALDLTAQEHF